MANPIYMRQYFEYILLLCFSVFVLQINVKAQNSFGKVDQWMENHTPEMGGRSLLMVYQNGYIVYQKSVNVMSPRQKLLEKMIARKKGNDSNTADYTSMTRLPVASCSKWLSAALVMTFVDEGRLKLTDSVGSFLPVLTKSGKGAITVSQCLSHLTAIKAPPLKESLGEMKEISSMDDAIKIIAALPMEGKPGTIFHYSNAGLQIAGAVIEKISGKSFETLFAERIAGPLQMKNTDFGNSKLALPAGGAVSTAEDYIHFLTMILNKGVYNGNRILSEKSIAEMQINRLGTGVSIAYSPAEAGDFGYGYGEWVMGSSSISHLTTAVTSPGLFGSFPWINYEKQYAAFLVTFYIKNTGRNERYKELKSLLDESVSVNP